MMNSGNKWNKRKLDIKGKKKEDLTCYLFCQYVFPVVASKHLINTNCFPCDYHSTGTRISWSDYTFF